MIQHCGVYNHRMMNRIWRFTLLSCILACGFANTSSATFLTVNNFSFEADVLGCAAGPSCFDFNNIPAWTIAPGSGTATFKPSTGAGGEFPAGVPDGVNVAALGNGFNSGDIRQTLSATLLANTKYTLKLFLGQRSDFPFSIYTASLEANGSVLASDSTLAPPPGTFLPDTIIYNSGASPAQLGQLLVIHLFATGLTVAGAPGQADFDNVTLDASPTGIPEAATGALLSVGLIALSLLRRPLRET